MNLRIFFCSLVILFFIFQQDIYATIDDPIDCEIERLFDPNATCGIVTPPTCPAGQTGVYPNCSTPRTCPAGQTGTYPNCITPPTCPAGQTGVYPNCATPRTCPTGQTGTYPNCITPQTCSLGQTGTYPNCITPSSGTIVVTGLYGESINMLTRGTDGSYSLWYNVLNRFFRAEGIAKYTSSQRVIRITTNRSQFYVQTPINTNGSWSVFDTTTPGYILTAFLQKGSNSLNISYYDKGTNSYITTGAQKISIFLQ